MSSIDLTCPYIVKRYHNHVPLPYSQVFPVDEKAVVNMLSRILGYKLGELSPEHPEVRIFMSLQVTRHLNAALTRINAMLTPC